MHTMCQCCYIKLGWSCRQGDRVFSGLSQSCVVSRACLLSVSVPCLTVQWQWLYVPVSTFPQISANPCRKDNSRAHSSLCFNTCFNPSQTSWPLQVVVVVITVLLSYRISESLVPYLDSSSPDSRNVSLVSGCVFVYFPSEHSLACFCPFKNKAWMNLIH